MLNSPERGSRKCRVDGEKVRVAVEVAAAVREDAPEEEGEGASRDGDLLRVSRPWAEEKPVLRQGPAFALNAVPRYLTSRGFPVPV
jgi:hypothetical protein